MADDFDILTAALAALMQRAAVGMTVSRSGPDGCELLAAWDNPARRGQRIWFGGVKRMKGYVSYHLMPVYTHAALAAAISPALKKRMQGKSCFNFRAEDPALFAELEALTREAARLYEQPFRLERPGPP
ncbi:MAG: hypothetical protein ACOY4K_16165 [Pseudomonadota bacterium]